MQKKELRYRWEYGDEKVKINWLNEKHSLIPSLLRRANALKVSLLTLYGGQFTFSTQSLTLDHLLYSPTDATSQFLQKLTPFIYLRCCSMHSHVGLIGKLSTEMIMQTGNLKGFSKLTSQSLALGQNEGLTLQKLFWMVATNFISLKKLSLSQQDECLQVSSASVSLKNVGTCSCEKDVKNHIGKNENYTVMIDKQEQIQGERTD